MTQDNNPAWLDAARARGWGDILRTVLDALEPLGPFGAQLVWASQPVLGLFFGRETVAGLATALETPGELDALRAALEGTAADNRAPTD
ncbi:MAG: hypothetical protein DIU68_015945 [Chloroflexota bacterium]